MIFECKKKTSYENKRSFGSCGNRRFVFELLNQKSSSKKKSFGSTCGDKRFIFELLNQKSFSKRKNLFTFVFLVFL